MKILSFAAAIAIAVGLMTGAASAHTISLGTFNAGAPGSVTVAMGAYDHGINAAEGSISLIGGPSAPAGPVAFGNWTTTQPAGLIDGVNNFHATGSFINGGPTGQYNGLSHTVGPALYEWQTATFVGLAPGLYTYQITGMNTVNWADWNSGDSNWTGQFIIPKSSTQAPEPASLLMLAGFAGFAAVRRRRRSQ